jgi:ribonuclease P protein component
LTPGTKPAKNNTRRGWFDRVFAQRETVGGPFLQLYLALSQTQPGRFGVSVSKRICPSAASRNYCKRTLRAWYRQHSEALAQRDLVVRVRRNYGRREFIAVKEEFAKLLRRLG